MEKGPWRKTSSCRMMAKEYTSPSGEPITDGLRKSSGAFQSKSKNKRLETCRVYTKGCKAKREKCYQNSSHVQSCKDISMHFVLGGNQSPLILESSSNQ